MTVAVLREPTAAEVVLRDEDLTWKTTKGSGAGGQARNKLETAIQLTHLPTGLRVRAESERSQAANRAEAIRVLRARLLQRKEASLQENRNRSRRTQVGSGMRGDKVRTIALQRGQVTDHRTGKQISAKAFLRGHLEGLY